MSCPAGPARTIVNRAVAELGPWSDLAPLFPLPTGVMAPLRAAAEAAGLDAFTPLWSGQAGALGRHLPVGDLVRHLSAGMDALLQALPDRLR